MCWLTSYSFPKRPAINFAPWPDEQRKNIGHRLQLLQEQFAGDIKKLEGQRGHYRLRVGGFRILFRLIEKRIEVYAVKQRKDAYE